MIDTFSALLRKLERLSPLDDDDRQAIRALPVRIRTLPSSTLIVREGDRVVDCALLLKGYACRQKTASTGGRQILSFLLTGDMLDLQHLLLDRADHNVETITEAVIAFIAIADLKRIAAARPRVGAALWRDTLVDGSIFREGVLNVGRRDGKTRVAHLLCEFAARREAAGLGSPERFQLPMTQEQIADATGLTAIHVNRMLRVLSDDGVLDRNRRDVQIRDWPRMCEIADFDPAYLHATA